MFHIKVDAQEIIEPYAFLDSLNTMTPWISLHNVLLMKFLVTKHRRLKILMRSSAVCILFCVFVWLMKFQYSSYQALESHTQT